MVERKVVDGALEQILLILREVQVGQAGCKHRGREVAEEQGVGINAQVPVQVPLSSSLQMHQHLSDMDLASVPHTDPNLPSGIVL